MKIIHQKSICMLTSQKWLKIITVTDFSESFTRVPLPDHREEGHVDDGDGELVFVAVDSDSLYHFSRVQRRKRVGW